MHVHLPKVESIAGFAMNSARPSEQVRLLCKAALPSDHPDFHRYINSFTSLLIAPARLLASSVHSFVAILHKDSSADVYVNDFDARLEVRPKKAVEAGELIAYSEIADIGRLSFPSISICPDDRVVVCLKCGWRFGLYFDLTPPRDGRILDIKQLEIELGALYRRVSYSGLYDWVSSERRFEALTADGWFPFIELLGPDLDELFDIFSADEDRESRLTVLERRFTPDKVERMVQKWWPIAAFERHRQVLEAGIEAFHSGTPAGDVLCIKTLVSEIEGILRDNHYHVTGLEAASVRQATDPLRLLVNERSDSLYLPRQFLSYLQRVTFAPFDVVMGQVPLSRHSASHGVAKPSQYTHRRALQVILTLDQLAYFMSIPL